MVESSRSHRRGRLARVPALTLVVLMATGTIALAARPVKGVTYAGTIKQGNNPISFWVSRNAKRVTNVVVERVPAFCESGGAVPNALKFKTAAISREGTFKTTGRDTRPTGPAEFAVTLRLTGKFLSRGREKGKLKVIYPNDQDCSGSTTYTTEAP